MKTLTLILFWLEIAIQLPSFTLCVGILFFSKNKNKANKVVGKIVGFPSWVISLSVWFLLAFFLFF